MPSYATPPPTATKITEIATILVPVTDQDRAITFYLENLGFEKKMDVPFGPNRWVEVGPAGSTTTLALAAQDAARIVQQPPRS